MNEPDIISLKMTLIDLRRERADIERKIALYEAAIDYCDTALVLAEIMKEEE